MPQGSPTIRNGGEQTVTATLSEAGSSHAAFVDRAPIGILHVDTAGMVTFENDRLRVVTDRTAGESWVGHGLGSIDEVGEQLLPTVQWMLTSGQPLASLRVSYTSKSGSTSTFLVHGAIIKDEMGTTLGVSLAFAEGVAHDELEEELRFRRVFDTVEPILRNAALSLPSEHAFLDEVARQLGDAAGADQVYVLLSAEDADAYEEEVRWAREPERSLVPLRMEVMGTPIANALGEGVVHVSATDGVGSLGEVDLLGTLGAAEALAVPFQTAGERRGVLLLTRAPASPGWSDIERRLLERLGALLETLLGWMRTEERYRYVISTIEDSLVAFTFDSSEERTFSFVTHQIERLSGYAADDFLDRRISWVDEVVHPPDRPAVKAFDRRVRAGEECRLVYRIDRPDGKVRWIRESLTPRHDSAGRLAVAGVLSDVTDQKEAEAALVQAKQDAEAADRLKSAFLATMSHEMRTPLGVIRGFSDLLCDEIEGMEDIPEEVYEFVGTIKSNAARVLQLVGDLLDLSRLQTDRLPLESAPVAVSPLVRDVALRYRSSLDERGIRLELGDSKIEPIALGDCGRIEQVIDIVMSNAAKFTEQGLIAASWATAAEQVVIEISDTGIGVGEDFVEQVFEPFVQEDNRLNRDFEGTGLGLALARRLMNAMGGAIDIRSARGEGTTVRLALKRADA